MSCVDSGPGNQRERKSSLRILMLSQVYHPDVASAGQHLTDLGTALAARGHKVRVISSRRAYDDPATKFCPRETYRGVEIVRVWCAGFGKGAKWRRAVDFASFIISSFVRLLIEPKPDVVIALTAPPLISFLGALGAVLRGCRFVYWIMDLNPDEAIAAGWLRPRSLAARFLERISRFALGHASEIVVLDRFMCDRLLAKGVPKQKISILPPWAHDEAVRFDAESRREFRRAHGLENKFVVMYSGNHSPCHPLTTVLDAAKALAADKKIAFCFIGGGSEFRKIQQQVGPSLPNVICLPYQPLNKLAGSLSAADLHVVAMGNPFVGMVHPCKIYNIMSVGVPVLYVGPEQSHLADILREVAVPGAYESLRHGDVTGAVGAIQRMAARHSESRVDYGNLPAQFAQGELLPPLIAVIENPVRAGALRPAASQGETAAVTMK